MRIVTVQKILFVILILWAGTFLASFHFSAVSDNPNPPPVLINASSYSYVNYGFHLGKRSPKGEEEEEIIPFPKELTVTLLNWKRKDCLQSIIRRAQDYRDFISEILIGNNNPDVTITAKDFDSPYIPLRVYNFPQNRLFYARYELCLMGTGKYCYFQDDDWENKHLRSLYANFLRYPHLLHTDTNAFVHYLSWAWTFFEPTVNMHTGFSWVGTGGIASKENVRRFTETQVPLLPRESSRLADMYFSTWFNQVPYQLENELVELEQKYGFSNEPGGIKRNKYHITEGVKQLYSMLKDNSTLFTREEEHPKVEERYTKSPCQDDDCLFTTSLHSFPSPRQLIYEPRWDLETGELLHSQMFEWKKFVNNPYHHAVDDKLETSWMSLSDVEPKSFYGLDFLQPGHYMDIYVDVGHNYQNELALESSFDGITWVGNETCAWSRESTSSGNFHYWLISKCVCKFRYIRFRALQSYPTPMQVFNIHHTDRFKLWKQDSTIVACGQSTLPVSTPYRPDHFLPEIGYNEIKVSLVLLHWKRLSNLHTIFAHIATHTFINEYIIWNNNIEIHLNESQLFPEGVPAHVNLRIINSPQNVHDFAKYMACSMATNKYCYFQDDDWLNIYLKSQYSQFLRFPELFHSITIPIINLEHRRWNVFNEEAGLHAGFSWLGVGSFIPRNRAEKFLEQLSHIQIKHDEMLQADIFFSYFTNDYPWELSAVAYPLSQNDAWSNSVDQWSIVYSRLSIAATTVLTLLENKDNKVVSRALPSPSYNMREVRAPCHDDNGLFMTNIASFPDPEKVVFNGKQTIKEQEQTYNALDWPSNWYWMDNSYERAVDGNPFTCWTSYRVAQVGDYFGLDLLYHRKHNNFTVVLDHEVSYFNVLVSPNGVTWDKAEFSVVSARMLADFVRSYFISLEYTNPFRFIRFEVQDELATLRTHFAVYEVFEGDEVKGVPTFGANKILDPSFEQSSPEDEEQLPTASDWYIQHSGDDMSPNLGNNVENKKTIVSFTGTRSLRFSSSTGATISSASQIIDLDQQVPRKVVISAVSKAEGVVNMKYPEAGYSLVVDVTYMDGTSKWNMHVSVFSEGTHDWQSKTIYLNEDKPLKSIMLHLFFKNHKGTVYFDDVSVLEDNMIYPNATTPSPPPKTK